MTIKVGIVQSAGAAFSIAFDKEVTAFLLWNETKFATDATNVMTFWTKGYAAASGSVIKNQTADGMVGVKEATNGITETTTTTFSDTGSSSITGITKANPAVITTDAAHGFVAGDTLNITGVYGMVEINGDDVTIASVTATTITTATDASAYTAAGVNGLSRRVNDPDGGEVEFTKTTTVTVGTACAGANDDDLHYIAIMADEYEDHGDQA